jgi:hypothetical protein
LDAFVNLKQPSVPHLAPQTGADMAKFGAGLRLAVPKQLACCSYSLSLLAGHTRTSVKSLFCHRLVCPEYSPLTVVPKLWSFWRFGCIGCICSSEPEGIAPQTNGDATFGVGLRLAVCPKVIEHMEARCSVFCLLGWPRVTFSYRLTFK